MHSAKLDKQFDTAKEILPTSFYDLVKILVIFSAVCSCSALAKTNGKIPQKVYVYGSEADYDFRLNHTVAVVKAALEVDEETLGPVELHSTDEFDMRMNLSRAFLSVQQNSNLVHIISSFASSALDRKLLPIRISIAASALGERIFLIRPEDRSKIESVSSIADLKKFTIGVGQGWVDGDIMQHAGLRIERSVRYNLLFTMLQAHRFDLLSRAVHEAWDELRTRGFRDFDWEASWLLSYPAPYYLYVNKKQKELAKRLTYGLQKLEASGRLGEIFIEHFGHAILRANWSRRRRISIPNPYLPVEAPLGYKSWQDWHKKAHQDLEGWFQQAKSRFRPPWSGTYRPEQRLIQEVEGAKNRKAALAVRAANRANDTHMLAAVYAIEHALGQKVNQKSDYYQRPIRHIIDPSLDQKTALEALNKKKSALDIIATQSSKERESEYITARVDIVQGLIGTRILIVHRDNEHLFKNVENVEDLRQFRICVGRDWPDRTVLEHAKIPILTKVRTDELYQDLELKRCDAISLAIYEGRDELLAMPLKPFVIDSYLILSYPATQQLFVNKGKPELATALEKGLKAMESQGLLNEIIELIYGDSIRHVSFKERKIIPLVNPMAPAWLRGKQPKLQERLWFQ